MNKKSWIWIVAVVLVVCIGIVCVILFTGKKDGTSAQKAKQETVTDSKDGKDGSKDNKGGQNTNGNNAAQNGNAGQNGGTTGNSDLELPEIEIPVTDNGGGNAGGNAGGNNGGGAGQQGGDGITRNENGDIVLPEIPIN